MGIGKEYILIPLEDFSNQFKGLATQEVVSELVEASEDKNSVIHFSTIGNIHIKSNSSRVVQLTDEQIKKIDDDTCENRASF